MTSVAAAASSSDWLSTADRLALLIQRFAIAEDKVAQQLGWPLEQLRAYLSPETRQQQAASDVRSHLSLSLRVALGSPVDAGCALWMCADRRHGGGQAADALPHLAGAAGAWERADRSCRGRGSLLAEVLLARSGKRLRHSHLLIIRGGWNRIDMLLLAVRARRR
jgi:hypothetical protein